MAGVSATSMREFALGRAPPCAMAPIHYLRGLVRKRAVDPWLHVFGRPCLPLPFIHLELELRLRSRGYNELACVSRAALSPVARVHGGCAARNRSDPAHANIPRVDVALGALYT